MKPRILYIEDMKKCQEFTRKALGDSYETIPVDSYYEALYEIKANIGSYDAIISDVNLSYDETKPNDQQTKEGLELIDLARRISKERDMGKFPIFCISSDGSHRKPSLKAGANIFMWKKAFWGGKGKRYLDKILEYKARTRQ